MEQTQAVLVVVLCAFVAVLFILVLSFYTPLCDAGLGCCFKEEKTPIDSSASGSADSAHPAPPIVGAVGVTAADNPDANQADADDPLIRDELNDEGRDHGLGRIRFSLTYDWTSRQLSVKICEARGLPAMDFPLGTSDPYCKVSILPDKANRVQTKVRSRKLNPTWNEVFLFENFPGERLLDRTLLIQVLDYDRFSRDDPIGDAQFPLVFLHTVDGARRSLTLWRNLQPNRKTRGFVGELLLALSYNPHSNQLNLVLCGQRISKRWDLSRTSDPYCVAKLVHSKTRRVCQRRRSTVVRRSLSPQWNESFTFGVPADKVHEYHLELVVKDKDFLGSETIGRIRLGTRSCPSETAHWTEVLSKPRQQTARRSREFESPTRSDASCSSFFGGGGSQAAQHRLAALLQVHAPVQAVHVQPVSAHRWRRQRWSNSLIFF
uniref:Synaptotagmin-7 n=1 Tax=Macrostomum lignano TaxID=282301 RepID=A0A1I8F4E4_9PLAT